jgi:hypothetical protein
MQVDWPVNLSVSLGQKKRKRKVKGMAMQMTIAKSGSGTPMRLAGIKDPFHGWSSQRAYRKSTNILLGHVGALACDENAHSL